VSNGSTVPRAQECLRLIFDARFAAAVEDLAALEVDRYLALRFLRRVFEPRATVTAYDAVHVALAEEIL
jgi:predicted nucleic acid-binding protein